MQYTYNALADSLQINQVEIYSNFNQFPSVGSSDFLYFDKSSNKLYSWNSGSNTYVATSISITTAFTTGAAVGGFKANTTISNTSLDKVIERLLVPGYINSSSLTTGSKVTLTTPQAIDIEVGNSIFTGGSGDVTAPNTSNLIAIDKKFNQLYSGSMYTSPKTNSYNVTGDNKYGNITDHFSTTTGYTEFYFSAKDDFNQSFESLRFRINWVHQSFAVANTSNTFLNGLTNYNELSSFIISNTNVLARLTTLTKPSEQVSKYIYIFLPTSYTAYSTITSSGFLVPYTTSQITLTKTVDGRNTTVLYNVYSTVNSFFGSITLNMS